MDKQKFTMERRKCSRIAKPYIISFYDKHDPEKKHDLTQIKNIGWGGMCFSSSKPYKPGTSLSIESQTSYLDDPVHLEGVVIESCEKVPDLLYVQHLAFHKLNSQAEFVLKKIIENTEEDPNVHSFRISEKLPR